MTGRAAALPVALAVGSLAGAAGWMAAALRAAPPRLHQIAAYATPLSQRSASQRHNVRLACAALDGQVIAPAGVLSFNRVVRSWSFDRGYVKAPVSFEGELVRAYGGGVCQVSSTLYNAALLAGLDVLERHPHTVAPSYVAPGRDAAVAQMDIDLRVRNPFAWPVTVRASSSSGRVELAIWASGEPRARGIVISRVVGETRPERLVGHVSAAAAGTRGSYQRSPGCSGYRTVTYRAMVAGGRELSRRRLSDDTYRGMDRVVALSD